MYFATPILQQKLRLPFANRSIQAKPLVESPEGEASKQCAKVRCADGRYAVSFNSVKIGGAIQSIDNC